MILYPREIRCLFEAWIRPLAILRDADVLFLQCGLPSVGVRVQHFVHSWRLNGSGVRGGQLMFSPWLLSGLDNRSNTTGTVLR